MSGISYVSAIGALKCYRNHTEVDWCLLNDEGVCLQCDEIVKQCQTCARNWISRNLDKEGRCTHCTRGDYWREAVPVTDSSERSESEEPDSEDNEFIDDEQSPGTYESSGSTTEDSTSSSTTEDFNLKRPCRKRFHSEQPLSSSSDEADDPDRLPKKRRYRRKVVKNESCVSSDDEVFSRRRIVETSDEESSPPKKIAITIDLTSD